MEIRPVRTKSDYRAALKEIESLMSARPGSADGKRLDVRVTLVEAYERKHFPMDLPDPVEAIKFVMDQRGLSAKDLEPMIGRSNRVRQVRLLRVVRRAGHRGADECAAPKRSS